MSLFYSELWNHTKCEAFLVIRLECYMIQAVFVYLWARDRVASPEVLVPCLPYHLQGFFSMFQFAQKTNAYSGL